MTAFEKSLKNERCKCGHKRHEHDIDLPMTDLFFDVGKKFVKHYICSGADMVYDVEYNNEFGGISVIGTECQCKGFEPRIIIEEGLQ